MTVNVKILNEPNMELVKQGLINLYRQLENKEVLIKDEENH